MPRRKSLEYIASTLEGGRGYASVAAMRDFAKAKEAKKAEPGQKKSRETLPAPTRPRTPGPSRTQEGPSTRRSNFSGGSTPREGSSDSSTPSGQSGGPSTRKGRRPPVAKDTGGPQTRKPSTGGRSAVSQGGPSTRKGQRPQKRSGLMKFLFGDGKTSFKDAMGLDVKKYMKKK